MRVKLQLVLCSDDGREETVTDIVSLNKDCHRLEHLGLTLAESVVYLGVTDNLSGPLSTGHNGRNQPGNRTPTVSSTPYASLLCGM